jgi:3-oxoacyl-[acyl-carrier protein] reductase
MRLSTESKLAGRRALVTGAGQGLGRAIAQELIQRGCSVALHYHSSRVGAEELAALARENGNAGVALQADLTAAAAAASLVAAASKALGGLDILINNAGDLLERRTIGELDEAFWMRTSKINIESLMWVTRSAVPFLAQTSGGASIVNLSSLAGRKGGHPGSLAYSTAKAAVIGWTRALSVELAPQGIRVNAVAPGLILGTRFHDTHTTRESADRTISQIPLGRAGTPEDVARAVAFFASEFDGFITGAVLDINGGVYLA